MAAAGKSTYQEHDRRYQQRWFRNPSHNNVVHTIVPEDVERRTEHTPCFLCGASGACKHRKWMLADG